MWTAELVYHRGGIPPRAAVFIKGTQCRAVPGFVTGDLAALQIKSKESGDRKEAVVRTAYFPSDSRTPPPLKKKKNSAVCVRTRTVNVNTFSTTVKDEISEEW